MRSWHGAARRPIPEENLSKHCCISPPVHRLRTSSLRIFQDLLDALLALGIPVQTSLLLLSPLLQLSLHLSTGFFKLSVPVRKCFFCFILRLEHTQQVLCSEGVNGFGFVKVLGCAPVMLELALNDGGLLGQLCKHLFIQRRHRLVSDLANLLPNLLQNIGLRLALHVVLLRTVELFHGGHFVLNTIPCFDIIL